MTKRQRLHCESLLTLMIIAAMITLSFLPTAVMRAAPMQRPILAPTVTTVEIDAIDDAGTTSAVPTASAPNAYLVLNARGDGSFDWNFIQFDLRVLPANATIDSAELHLNIYAAGGPVDVELGRADGAWDELSLNWNNKPGVTWGGPVTTVAAVGDVQWPAKALVSAWHEGTTANYGLVLRGTSGTGAGVRADSKEWGVAPKLVITYSTPAEDGPRTDLGDAPDSTNHHGRNNTAYPGSGTLGNFPTVWDVPAGQVAGPRHRNATREAWLGDVISPELDADQGADLDGPNNILRGASGAIGDVADNDRGDDGWRNRNIKFFDCQRATLDIRVSKDVAATRNFMYLNVWFDGNRDGDWQDLGQCQANEGEPAQASYEWLVQNYIVDLNAIPAGGSYDFAVNTQKVLNSATNGRHWMRFMLSEEPATQPAEGGLPDGRGPHPTSTQQFYQFGETEDVIQKPPPAGEDGTLVLQKRVVTDGSPVPYAGKVTYEISLRNEGGSQPVQAQIRDALTYPQHVLPELQGSSITYINVSSPTGGVAPLQAQLNYQTSDSGALIQQLVRWEGSLAPNAEVRLHFDVHVHPLCRAGQQTVTINNVAQARAKDGEPITDEVSFTAACPGYNPDEVEVTAAPINSAAWNNVKNVSFDTTIQNRNPVSVTVGFYQARTVDSAATLAGTVPMLGQITVGPNSTAMLEDLALTIEYERVANELDLTEEVAPSVDLGYCILPGEETVCPDAAVYPELHHQLPVTLTVRPNDLGDAPDSTNHAAMTMDAYPGVQANFPTVFDPATGQPEGPRHRFPAPLHLGQLVSREAEADTGPDQDPTNNLLPTTNDADNDRGDDGPVIASWNFNHCQQTVLQTRITVSPQAVTYFQNQNAQAYLNVWIDSNRDGDWADVVDCNGQPAPEHILIDSPVNVVAMGAGLHTIGSQTGLVPWTITDKPAWVRVTLSERPSNKTLQSGNVTYGDGRGYAQPFITGETEDFYFRPLSAGGGPDIEVQMTAESRRMTAQELGMDVVAAGKLGNFEIQMFKIDYSNQGTLSARGAGFNIGMPPTLQGGRLVFVKAPGIPPSKLFAKFDGVDGEFMDLAPGDHGTIVLGWTGCLTCTLTAASTDIDFTAQVTVSLDDDIDPSNNQSSATTRGLLSSPIVGLQMPASIQALCNNEVIEGFAVTNRTTVTLQGRAAPNQQLTLYTKPTDKASPLGVVTTDHIGNFNFVANLAEGLHTVYADYVVAPRDPASGLPTGKLRLAVKPSLPFDPSSICFVDSQQRSYTMPTLGFSFGVEREFGWLRSGETYKVYVSGLSGASNQAFKVTFEDVIISSLVDEDRDGTYEGWATFPSFVHATATAAAATLGVIVDDGQSESTFKTTLVTAADGVIVDGTTGQPLAGANVALLKAEEVVDGATIKHTYVAQGQAQFTGADGLYRFGYGEGLYRVDVLREGYQPYRTAEIDGDSASVNRSIALTPQVADATTHTVYITANGFEPATLTVAPNSVIEFINVDLTDHIVSNGTVDSGLLAPSQSYKVKVGQSGTTNFSDATDLFIKGTVIVDGGTFGDEHAIFLPLVQR